MEQCYNYITVCGTVGRKISRMFAVHCSEKSEIECEVEGNLVKVLNHCRLENMKNLVEPKFFWNCPT